MNKMLNQEEDVEITALDKDTELHIQVGAGPSAL